jgi:hypothetical protein
MKAFRLCTVAAIHKYRSTNYTNLTSCIKIAAIISPRSDYISFVSNLLTLVSTDLNLCSDILKGRRYLKDLGVILVIFT